MEDSERGREELLEENERLSLEVSRLKTELEDKVFYLKWARGGRGRGLKLIQGCVLCVCVKFNCVCVDVQLINCYVAVK